MKFNTSAEVALRAHAALARCQRRIDPLLDKEFAGSTVASFHCTLRCVPIIMPEDMRANYPERSKRRPKEQTYDCAPALVYDIYVSGSSDDQHGEYVRGIKLTAPHLATLGASNEQSKEFHEILGRVVCFDRES